MHLGSQPPFDQHYCHSVSSRRPSRYNISADVLNAAAIAVQNSSDHFKISPPNAVQVTQGTLEGAVLILIVMPHRPGILGGLR